MQYAPTRVRAKFVQFHISAHGYTKNAPDFRPKPLARNISGRMQYAPTRVHPKFGGFHISAHGCAKNAPDFTLPNRDTPKTYPVLDPNLRRKTFGGVFFCAPTRVRAKPARFHTSAHGYTKNPPDFTLSNRDTPKTHPVLHLNHRRRTFRGVCNTPLHGYMKNPAGFRPKSSSQDISGRMLLRPYTGTCKICPVSYFRTRIRQKRTRFHPSQ